MRAQPLRGCIANAYSYTPRQRFHLCSPLQGNRVVASVQKVFKYKTSFLQNVQDHVRVGYSDYCCGYVEAHAAAGLARRFALYYRTDLDRNRRARVKKTGQACAVMLMHELNREGRLFWILLLSPGEHPARRLERLHSAHHPLHRISIDRFELVRMTRPGSDVPAWTWRLTGIFYDALRASVIDTVRRGKPRDIRVLIAGLFRMPGFRGVRIQVGKCCSLFRASWQRSRSDPLPAFPRKLFYVSRLPAISVPLTTWIAAQRDKAHAMQKDTGHLSAGSCLTTDPDH
jgi:hypothetical protein